MAEKSVRKRAVRLKEAPGQFSSQSHEPFSRKCLYKESDPEILAYPPKKSGKLSKNAESLPFVEGNVFATFQIILSSGSLTKKILTFNLHTDGKEERGFDVKKLHTKCSPLAVCPFENDNCCMAHLSKQEDFKNQISMLEAVIWEAGHECLSSAVNLIPLKWCVHCQCTY